MTSSADDDTTVYSPAGPPATDAAAPGSAPDPEANGRVGHRRAAGRRDPMTQLRALREEAADLARTTDTPGSAPDQASPAAAGGSTAYGAPSAYSTAGVVDPDHTSAVPTVAPAPPPSARRAPRVRKARLRLLRVDPWSVMKVSFLLSIAAGIALTVAVAVLWSILEAAGVFSTVGDVLQEVTASEQTAGFDVVGLLSLSRVLGFTALLGVVDVILVTALATLGAFLYNLAASLLGGLEVTLAEDD